MNSELMRSAGNRLQFYQGSVISPFQTREVGNGLTPVNVIDALQRSVQPVHAQGLVNNSRIPFHNSADPGKIGLVGFSFLKLLAEASGGKLAVSPLQTREFYGVAVDKRRPDVLAAANAVIAEGGAK